MNRRRLSTPRRMVMYREIIIIIIVIVIIIIINHKLTISSRTISCSYLLVGLGRVDQVHVDEAQALEHPPPDGLPRVLRAFDHVRLVVVEVHALRAVGPQLTTDGLDPCLSDDMEMMMMMMMIVMMMMMMMMIMIMILMTMMILIVMMSPYRLITFASWLLRSTRFLRLAHSSPRMASILACQTTWR
jgi:hypothetical protein